MLVKRTNESDSTAKLVYQLFSEANFSNKDFYVENAGETTWVEALKGASKSLKGKQGIPDFNFQSGRFHILIENKKDFSKLETFDENDNLLMDIHSIQEYAVNGAVHYAKWVVEHSSIYDKIFALGIVGSPRRYKIQPYYVENGENGIIIKRLSDVLSFDNFREENIEEYYKVSVLGELSRYQEELKNINEIAYSIHEDLRNYGNLGADNKATVVSAILLALRHGLTANQLLGGVDSNSDGNTIFRAIEDELNILYQVRSKKIGSLLDTFRFITTDVRLNTKLVELGNKTPLWHFTDCLSKEVYHRVVNGTPFDILGSFYSEFVKYGGNDGSDLGIVLTPLNVTSLMADLIEITPTDTVIDPATGTGAFLIASMQKMIEQVEQDDVNYKTSEDKKRAIKKIKSENLYGIELKSKLYAISATNMILRNDGRAHLEEGDMFHLSLENDGKFDKLLMNPPYSQAKTKVTSHLSEMNFMLKALSRLKHGGRAAFIVPQSTVTSGPKAVKDADYRELKQELLDNNRIIAVITMNPKTFYPYGTSPIVIVLEHGVPQKDNRSILYDFRDDGNVLNPHLGMLEDSTAIEKRKRLLDTIKDKIDVDGVNSIKTTLTADDEWLHSYFYFDDSIPTQRDFLSALRDYATFEYNMKISGRGDILND